MNCFLHFRGRFTAGVEPTVVADKVDQIRLERVPIVVTGFLGSGREFAELMYVRGVARNLGVEDGIPFGQILNGLSADVAVESRERGSLIVDGDFVTHGREISVYAC